MSNRLKMKKYPDDYSEKDRWIMNRPIDKLSTEERKRLVKIMNEQDCPLFLVD